MGIHYNYIPKLLDNIAKRHSKKEFLTILRTIFTPQNASSAQSSASTDAQNADLEDINQPEASTRTCQGDTDRLSTIYFVFVKPLYTLLFALQITRLINF